MVSLTDWLFMGDWLYSRYNQFPEIWRHPHGQGEMKAIAWSVPLPFITCAVFTLLCARLNLHSYSATLKLAAGYLACWTFAVTHHKCSVYQTAPGNHGVLFPGMAGRNWW